MNSYKTNEILAGYARHAANNKVNNNEKTLRETQTMHAGCIKAEPKKFAPPQIPSRGLGTAKI